MLVLVIYEAEVVARVLIPSNLAFTDVWEALEVHVFLHLQSLLVKGVQAVLDIYSLCPLESELVMPERFTVTSLCSHFENEVLVS